jgi:hypothetical protein
MKAQTNISGAPGEAVGRKTQVTRAEGNGWVLLHSPSWEVHVWGLKGSQQQVLRVGLGVWVLLKSLWGLPSSEMDSAKARYIYCLPKFWRVEAGSPATLSSSTMPFHVSRMHPPPSHPVVIFFSFLTFHFLCAAPRPATALI